MLSGPGESGLPLDREWEGTMYEVAKEVLTDMRKWEMERYGYLKVLVFCDDTFLCS